MIRATLMKKKKQRLGLLSFHRYYIQIESVLYNNYYLTFVIFQDQERKRKAILDLNTPYVEPVENDFEIVLPSKENDCLVRTPDKTPETTINVNKYKTVASSKLIGMGCQACYVYVMVLENHRICPKCGQAEYLIDIDAHVHANKKRNI